MADGVDGTIVEANNPGVKEVVKNWSVYEDGALAYQLQEEENVNHYTGNVSRRRTVRGDREVAKDVAKEAALEAFREEHEIAERNRRLEEEDRERARLLQIQMIQEEQEIALQARDSDEMLARRMQMEEKRKLEAARKKRIEAEQMTRDAQLARRLSQQENGHHRPPHSGKHKTKTDYVEVEDSMGAMKLDDSQDTNHAHTHAHSHSHSHSHSRSSSSASGGGAVVDQPLVVAMDTRNVDSDEESDVLAKMTHDEQFARRIQREEVQRSRPRTLSEEQQKQLVHDEKIARKMQHEEVMLAKKKTYNKYKQRVSDEIADPAPMVHVSKEKKIAVLADAKEGQGITLTDVTLTSAGRDSQPNNDRTNGGNILASIDPTYNPGANTNVVLTKRTPITNSIHSPEPVPEPVNGAAPPDFEAIQGTKRTTGKEKKRGSFFSKLKKK